MIYQVKNLATGVWVAQVFYSTDDAADYAHELVKRAILRRRTIHLAVLGGNKIFSEYKTTGEIWYT